MNYSMMAHVFTNYGKKCIYVGCFAGGCYLSFGFGLIRGQKYTQTAINEIDEYRSAQS
jgi:hypothetical protein